MNNKQQKEEQLVRYLDGELEGTELTAFEEALASDFELRAGLENLSVARLAIQHYGLRAQVAAVHRTTMAEFEISKEGRRAARVYPLMQKLMRAAAAVLLFVVAFGGYEIATVTSAGLSKEKYLTYDLNVLRGTAATTSMELAYNNHDYYKTLTEYRSIKSPKVKEQFVAAQAYLATGNAANAIREFTEVLAKTNIDNTYKDDVQYYLGVSYLADNQPAKAEPIFKRIYEDKYHLYHSKVTYWTMLRLKLLVIKSSAN